MTWQYILLALLIALVIVLTVRREMKRHREHKAFMQRMEKLREKEPS